METTSDVRRRKRNDEHSFRLRRAIWDCLRFEEALRFPPVVPSGFYSLRVVSCCHWLRHVYAREGIRNRAGTKQSGPPFFSPLGVVLTNAGSSAFFSFSPLTFFSPAGVDAACLSCFAASLASFSSLFASFLAGMASADGWRAKRWDCLPEFFDGVPSERGVPGPPWAASPADDGLGRVNEWERIRTDLETGHLRTTFSLWKVYELRGIADERWSGGDIDVCMLLASESHYHADGQTHATRACRLYKQGTPAAHPCNTYIQTRTYFLDSTSDSNHQGNLCTRGNCT